MLVGKADDLGAINKDRQELILLMINCKGKLSSG